MLLRLDRARCLELCVLRLRLLLLGATRDRRCVRPLDLLLERCEDFRETDDFGDDLRDLFFGAGILLLSDILKILK